MRHNYYFSCSRRLLSAGIGILFAATLVTAKPAPAKAKMKMARASGARYRITGIADIHLRDTSAKAAQFVMGHLLGFDRAFTLRGRDGRPVIYYKVNDHQFLEITPGWAGPLQPRYETLAWRTTNARALRDHLLAAHFAPGPVHRLRDGNLGFNVQDPEGYDIQFVQYLPNSMTGKLIGKLLSPRRIGGVIIHTGYQVMSKSAEDRFYASALHFPEMWYGGMHMPRVDWFDRRAPNGPDWLEYMLDNSSHPSLRERAVLNHFSIGVYHMHVADRKLLARGWKPTQKPQIGRDGKWQLNLYTEAGTRIELMGPHPVQKPCCSVMHKGGW